MTHETIFNLFKMYFPEYAGYTASWKANDKDSICLRYKNKKEFIFTYKNENNWSFGTKKYFSKKE